MSEYTDTHAGFFYGECVLQELRPILLGCMVRGNAPPRNILKFDGGGVGVRGVRGHPAPTLAYGPGTIYSAWKLRVKMHEHDQVCPVGRCLQIYNFKTQVLCL